jgi:hypothetical protein
VKGADPEGSQDILGQVFRLSDDEWSRAMKTSAERAEAARQTLHGGWIG